MSPGCSNLMTPYGKNGALFDAGWFVKGSLRDRLEIHYFSVFDRNSKAPLVALFCFFMSSKWVCFLDEMLKVSQCGVADSKRHCFFGGSCLK